MKKIRCAIYTRKSAEAGLEQEFNSLDAQREACAAYVASQKAEGWVLLPTVYEDAGISGGTLERPGLQRLLTDIDAGLVEQIVVYKVDRLTRSLSDFAKLVERLEAAGAVFVSGFARNLAAMRPIWIVFLLVSTATCWYAHFVAGKDVVVWVIVSTLLALILVPLAFWVLPGYVRTKATSSCAKTRTATTSPSAGLRPLARSQTQTPSC